MSYRSLLSQLRKLQAMLASSPAVANTTRTTQVGACLMVWHATCSTKISFIHDICMTLPHSECCIATLSLRVLAHMHSINLSDTDTYTQHTPLMKIQHLSRDCHYTCMLLNILFPSICYRSLYYVLPSSLATGCPTSPGTPPPMTIPLLQVQFL